MLHLKRYFTDDVLRIALLLSLLRIDRQLLEYDAPTSALAGGGVNATEGVLLAAAPHITRKNIDRLLGDYEQELFEELNALGRYAGFAAGPLAAFLANVGDTLSNESEEASESEVASTSTAPERLDESVESVEAPLTEEDLNLIESLWKYDVHIEGANTVKEEPTPEKSDFESTAAAPDEPFAPDGGRSLTPEGSDSSLINLFSTNFTLQSNIDDLAGPSSAENLDSDDESVRELFSDKLLDSDPWMGAETFSGFPWNTEDEEEKFKFFDEDNFQRKEEDNVDDFLLSSTIFGTELSLEETLQLINVDQPPDDIWEPLPIKTEVESEEDVKTKEEEEEEESKEDPGIEADFIDDEEFGVFSRMIHAPAPQYHTRSFQGRPIPPYIRTMGMDHHRWQEFAATSGYTEAAHGAYHHHHYHHGSDYGPMATPFAPYTPVESGLRNGVPHGAAAELAHVPFVNGCNISSATPSMSLPGNGTNEVVLNPDGTTQQFKVEPVNQEAVYPYQNGCTEMNHTTEGFLSSILNDEDLQLMDMAMNEGIGAGMYTMRMLENGCSTQNCAERGTDSDSAVSSMGSERVPSLSSDTEWMETNSDSGHTAGDHFAPDYCNKYRWYDNYLFNGRGPENSSSSRFPSSYLPQKKYQLYGRRCFQEQIHTADNLNHNHTYHIPPDAIAGASGTICKPLYKEKSKSKSCRKSEEEQLTRDEKRARNLNIPIGVYDIINLPMDEFNERLSKYDLSENQLSLIRDIRRRGKNKVAAQNCRKRKLDQIMCLADEVKEMKDRKQKLLHDRDFLVSEKQRVQNKYSQLYRHVFQSLRDSDGNPFSPYDFSLQQAADGSVILVPRNGGPNYSTDMDQSYHNSRSKHSKEQRKP